MAKGQVKDFITDEEMLEMEGTQKSASPEFISDKEMTAISTPEAPKEKTWKDKVRPYVEDLPSYGAAAGGLIGAVPGSIIPGAGTVAGGLVGAGAGGLIGGTARNVIRDLLYDEKPASNVEAVLDPLREGALGVAGEGVGVGAGKVLNVAGKGLIKGMGELSSVPQRAIETYSKRMPQVRALSKEFGGEVDEAARATKGKFSDRIDQFKKAQNAKLERSLSKSSEVVDVSPIIADLAEVTQKLDPVADKAAMNEISRLGEDIFNIAKESGSLDQVPVARANRIKSMLQNAADYRSVDSPLARNSLANSGVIKAGARANRIVSKAAPEVAEANKELSKLHRSSRKMNKNLIDPDASNASLIGAGAGTNPKSANDLRKLGDVLGDDFISSADDLAAMQYIENAGLLPSTMTGRSTIPLILGGAGAANELLQGDIEGAGKAASLGAFGSPAVLRQVLRSRALQKKLLPEISQVLTRPLSQELVRGLIGNER